MREWGDVGIAVALDQLKPGLRSSEGHVATATKGLAEVECLGLEARAKLQQSRRVKIESAITRPYPRGIWP
jgi:hypothetical protein